MHFIFTFKNLYLYKQLIDMNLTLLFLEQDSNHSGQHLGGHQANFSGFPDPQSIMNLASFYRSYLPTHFFSLNYVNLHIGLRIRSIFGRIQILPIRILKSDPDPDPGSYLHLKNQFKHQNFFHIKHISYDILMMIIFI